MKNKKGNMFVSIIILIMVAVASSVITWIVMTKKLAEKQTTNLPLTAPILSTDTATGWQIYMNNKFFYSLEIPQGFKIEESGPFVDVNTTADEVKRDVVFDGSYNCDDVIINLHIGTNPLGNGKCEQDSLLNTLTISDQQIEICKGDSLRADFYTRILLRDMFIEIIGDKGEASQTQELFEKFVASLKFTV